MLLFPHFYFHLSLASVARERSKAIQILNFPLLPSACFHISVSRGGFKAYANWYSLTLWFSSPTHFFFSPQVLLFFSFFFSPSSRHTAKVRARVFSAFMLCDILTHSPLFSLIFSSPLRLLSHSVHRSVYLSDRCGLICSHSPAYSPSLVPSSSVTFFFLLCLALVVAI